mmetsp:Transcript_4673/g.5906  ORF Transcript_4673/g.5906 Transcript_4673/m.5906 type:complete len:267 (+) Transcript_4673:316-1116(+)
MQSVQKKRHNHNTGGPKALMLDFHCDRLLTSFSHMFPVVSDTLKRQLRKKILVSFFGQILKTLPSSEGEDVTFFLTVLVYFYPEEPKIALRGHIMWPGIKDSLLVPVVAITTDISKDCNRIQSGAFAKSSAWINDRVPLESVKALTTPQSSEVLMTDPFGQFLLEGLITNVFVVVNGVVFTAPDDVLPGHMRHLVLQACEDLKIPVTLKAQSVDDMDTWDEVFLTSTTKPVCEVQKIVVFPSEKAKLLHTGDVGLRIQEHLLEYLL